jgi:hypothetical protein
MAFSEPEQALAIYDVLRNEASARRTLTYGLLAKLIGRPSSEGRLLAAPLRRLHILCAAKGAPAITAIVIGEKEREIGGWLLAKVPDPAAERLRIFQHDWSSVSIKLSELQNTKS